MIASARAEITLAAGALVMFVNDHALKRAYPGLFTGKLSDVAGMIFFPILLALFVRPLARRARLDWHHVTLALAAATAIVFTLTKTTDAGNEAYRIAWGALQWPLRAAAAWARGEAVPSVARVVLVKDPTDVIAVPFVAVAAWAARALDQKPTSKTPRSPARNPYPSPEPESV